MLSGTPRTLILSAASATVALDERDGAELWRTTVPLRSIVVKTDRLYGIDDNYRLCCLQRSDGARLWVFDEPVLTWGDNGEPVIPIWHDSIFCVTATNDVVALRPADGSVLWRYRGPGWAWDGVLAVSESLLFLQAHDANVEWSQDPVDHLTCALDAERGVERWRHAWRGVPLNDDPLVPAVADETTLYCRAGDGEVLSLAQAEGAVRWRFPSTSPVDRLTLLAPGVLGIATNAQVFALSSADGAVRWSYRDSRDGVYIEFHSARRAILPVTDLARVGDRLLVAINYDMNHGSGADPNRAGVLVALAPEDGTLLWRINAGQGARPLIASGSSLIGFVPTDPFYRYVGAIADDDGRELWRHSTTTFDGLEQGWHSGEVLYAVVDHALTALTATDGGEQWSYALTQLDPALTRGHYYRVSVAVDHHVPE